MLGPAEQRSASASPWSTCSAGRRRYKRVYRQIERVAATDATVLCLEKFGITTA
jgi:hypothetical protein